jgi:hypothetical protein
MPDWCLRAVHFLGGGVILQLTMPVSQSFDLGFQPLLGLMTRCLLLWHLLVFESLASSLPGWRVCPFVITDFICFVLPCYDYFLFLLFMYLFYFLYYFIPYVYLFGVCVCIFTARSLSPDSSRPFVCRSVRTLDRHQVWVFYVFGVGLYLFLCFEHSHHHDFVWFLPVSCMFSLWNHTHTEYGTPHACNGSVSSFPWTCSSGFRTGSVRGVESCPNQ